MNDEVRPLEERDLEQYAELLRKCFGGSFSIADRVRDLKEDPYLNLPLSLGHFANGKIVAAIRFPRRQMWLGPTTIDVGAMVAVCTEPTWRQRGYASDLLRRSLPLMAELGIPASMLFGFQFGFYRRLGWELAADYWTAFLQNTEFPQGLVPAVQQDVAERFVRPFKLDDLPQIEALHADAIRGEPGAFRRSRAWWEHLFRRGDYACAVWDDEGVQGYTIYRIVDRFGMPGPMETPPWQRDQVPQQQVEILEFVAFVSVAARGLLSFLHRAVARTGRLTFLAERHIDLARFGMLRPGTELHCGPSFMFRVVDLVPALQALDLPDLTGEHLAVIVDDPLVQTATKATIAFTPQAQNITAGIETADRIECDVQAFSQLFVGYRSAEQLHGEGRLRASSVRALRKAELLFPLGEPFLPALDVF